MTAAPSAYPLAWPAGWPRTASPQKGAYRTSLAGALKNLKTQVGLLCGNAAAASLVLSSNVTLGRENPRDPGVVAFFLWDKQAISIPCDRWLLVEANVQAIALTIEAMRAMDRHGAKHMIRAMFQGFTALPAATAGQRHWRTVLGFPDAVRPSSDLVRARHRELAKMAHSDVGGTDEAMAAINAARDQALAEIGT